MLKKHTGVEVEIIHVSQLCEDILNVKHLMHTNNKE